MKKMGLLKRTLSLMLALSITLSCVPVNVFAQETTPVPETTAPAETDPTETTAPADTQPPETTEPAPAETTEVTEPSVPETTVSTESTATETTEATEAIEVLHEHDYGAAVTAPTCTEQGYTTYTCTCGDSYVGDYVEAAGHTYENGTCTICGSALSNLANFKGKVISILGDSISTFAGYIPVADGFNLEHLARYPQDNLLTDVNETWWMQVINQLNANLGINDSWRGATVSGGAPVTSGTTGANAAMANLTRIQNLGSNGTPDVILFYGGTNDLAHVSSVGTFDPETAPTEVDLTTASWNNLADGYVNTLLRLRYYYPNAVVVAMLPTHTASYYSDTKLAQANDVLAEICEHYGVAWVDLRDSGVTAEYLPDGIHPGAEGMDRITNAVLNVLTTCEMEAGEHTVYPISHTLTNVKASLGHYKGIDAGAAFRETLSADGELLVTVDMNGQDITESCYSDGVIYISSVSGNLDITAKAKFSLEGHWQALPEFYHGINLWPLLDHDEMYYTVDGWGKHSSGKVRSVTVSVIPGEKLVASSFTAVGTNGGSTDGIRVTFFSEDGVLTSMSSGAVYEEFTKNGYLTVPENAVAVNIPMWTAAEDWELYIQEASWEPSFSLGDRLQELPESICCGTNLWNALESQNEYYSGSAWGNVAGGEVYSVTIPVIPGDQLWATSFQKSGTNGGSRNGIRLTWFGKNGVLKSASPDDVYSEFAANGYITAPEDANAANVVMWNGLDSNELYLMNRAHTYENGTCIICGSEHPDLEYFEGKVISILGGSTCTFAGYIPVADGFNLAHRPRYPQDNLLTDVNETWWMQLITQLDAKLGINDSWAGSTVSNFIDGNSGDLGEDAAMASLTRIQNLGSNGTPDIILFYGAMNDIGKAVTLGSFDPATAPKTVDLTVTKWDSLADAYVAAILRMQHYYPDALIVSLLPGPTASYYTEAELETYGAVLKAICDHYGVATIDLRESGLTTANLPDGTHPDAEGMDLITEYVLENLLANNEMEAGENVVYSVTHNLENAEASLSYYKGISAGKPFAETLTGENLAVTVTMGGEDITSNCYSENNIRISNVTGDVVVTAKASFSLGDRLQQLPKELCAGTNLWNVLTPVNEYYTTSGWGNNSNSNYSVTFPVTAGDKIWATSFGPAGENGYTASGVRITWFGEEGVLESLTREKVYAEFSVNGYLTVPENAVAVNIPMISNAENWEIYIQNLPHTYENGICTICGEKTPGLEHKTLSILGASISTYAGTSNGAAADTTNSTIRNNAIYYPHSVVTDVTLNDTWWMQAVNDLGLRLLVNNSWSGSSLLHERGGTVGAYVDRCVQLHDDTGDNAGEMPDIIAIQMGTNDFQYYKDTLGTADIDYDALIQQNSDGSYTYGTPVTSLEAAAIVLHKISVRYPNAEVYYLNISQRVDNTDELIQSFNAELKQVVEHFGTHIVDIYGSAITMADFGTYIGDGRVHPNKLGMDAYTEAFKRALIANTAYTVTTHTVSMELDGVTADYGDDKIVRSGDGYTLNLTAADTLDVTVTMGGEDITATAYAGGTVSIRAVTADVTIIAKSVHQAKNYRWEFNGTDLACVSGGNALTKNAGTTTDGVFSSTRYALQTPVVLSHDQPWSVEWKCEGTFLNANGSSGARVFTSDDVNANYNARYIFKSNTNGIIAMGEKTTTGSHNYGIALADHGIDWTALHTYRLENRIAADGSNMVYLYVDGAEIGPMNHYYVGTTDKKTTSDWLSGKDFVLAYMGTDTHGFTNCSIDYIQVWEGGKPEEKTESLSLRYDDHYDISGKTVEIVEAGTPTSYQVGYGVAEKTLDTAVIIIEGNHLVATGIGTAKVRIDGTLYEVTVTAAPISLLLLAGQSMMQGSEGDANQSIICPDGMVYATYGDRYTMTVDNATNFAPSALTGAGSTLNVNGNTTNLADWPVYLLNEAGAGKAGPDSGFAYEWVEQTGEKVWVVNAAHGGTSINAWQDGGTQYEECVALFSACQETLRREIAAGHYTLSHMGYFWRQGAADELQTAQWYVEKFLAMHEDLKTELACDLDGDGQEEILEFANISMEMAGHVGKTGYRYEGGRYDPSDSTFFSTYEELELRGHRVAQYWMAANPELTDINLVFNADAQWLTMPDGSNGVEEYFLQNYPNGTVDYTTQVKQKDSWYSPKTPLAVKDSIHFNQIGFNEMGIVSARNALILLGELEDTQEKTTVTFHNWTGYETVSSVEAKSIGAPGTLVVPIVSPCYRAKEVTYEVSEGLRYEYYDLLADTYNINGTLSAVGAQGSVSVTEASLSGYRWDLQDGVLVSTGETENVMTRLEGSTENGIFIDTRYQMARPFLLYHDQDWMLEWKMTGPWTDADSTAGKKLFSGDGRQYSEAFSISTKGNEEWLAFNYYNGSSHVHYGIDLAEHGLSLADTHIYRLYNEVGEDGNNVIWLAVDGTVLGPMDTHLNVGVKSDYLSGKDLYFGFLGTPKYWLDNGTIDYICVMETGASEEDIHFHDYSDWETVSVPTAETLGEQKRVCEGCGETQTREVEGSWQKYSLNDHMAQLPETLCGGVNLWSVLEHDLEYFSSNYAWAVHSSGKTASVTIPVKPGDRIYATSFGKAGENGGTKDGIRLTFFDAYDVCSSMAPENTYAEFTANGGYIVAPEGAVAANISMWTREDSNELYILNREHNYKSAITDPNCTEKGYTTHTCSGCGNSYVDSYTDALGHTDMTDKAVEATCTEAGLTEGKHCSVCDVVLVKQEVIPAKGHMEVIDAVVEATCTATGLTEGKHCSVCKTVLVKQETIPAKGHTEVIDKAVEATCTESGLTEGKHCSDCGTVLVKQQVIPAKGHTEVIDAVVEATCTATGLSEGKHCSVCKTVLVKQETIPAKGHTQVIDKAVAATCTESGLTEGKHCSACNTVLVKQKVIPAKGHMEVVDQAVAATCTESGLTEGKHCSVCNTVLVKQEVISAKGHTEVIDKAIEATCTTTGLTEGKHCSDCGTVLVKQQVIPAKGHTEVIDKAMEATCTEAGLTEGKHCSVCDAVLVKQEVIPAKGHTEVIDKAVEATCTATGLTEGKHCSVCKTVLVKQQAIPAKGHTEVVDQAVAATCTEAGLTEGKHCSACNTVLVKQKVIPAKGHMEVIDKAMEATCTEAGLTEGKHCSVCNTVLVKPSVIPSKGHVWNGGTCSVCGQTQGYRIDLDAEALGTEDSVWIDGVEYPAALDGRGWHAMLDHTDATNLVIYTYNDPGAQDVHTQYPIGMKVWTLHFENGAYTARYVPEFDNLLQYSGSSIRIVGVKGIRMITSIDKATRQALAGDGLAGYTLVEYGTAVAWDEDLGNTNPLVLGQRYTKSNFAYRQDVADPIFKDTGSLLQYTNVLVGFTDDQCIPDLAMRPYIIVEDTDGRQITIYGGIVCRSIGYIAWQNRAAFPAGSAAYEYVWSIIRHVYGDRYDAEYKG